MLELANLHDDHVFLRREALAHGYNDKDLIAHVRAGVLRRIRQGAYTLADVWDPADDLERHRLRSHAVLLSHGPGVVLSHVSAAVEHGLRLHRPDLSQVHLTTVGRHVGRTTPDISYHRASCNDDEITLVAGRAVIEPVRAALEVASMSGVADGLVVLDSVVDLGLGQLDDVYRAFERRDGWPNSRRLQVTVRLARDGSNSVGESLARHLMFAWQLPEPVLQFEVRDESGHIIGITDFAWPQHGLLGEFDGMHKYGRLLRAGETAGDAVEREKVREDALRSATNFLMVRLIWSELFRGRSTAERIARKLAQGRQLMAA